MLFASLLARFTIVVCLTSSGPGMGEGEGFVGGGVSRLVRTKEGELGREEEGIPSSTSILKCGFRRRFSRASWTVWIVVLLPEPWKARIVGLEASAMSKPGSLCK